MREQEILLNQKPRASCHCVLGENTHTSSLQSRMHGRFGVAGGAVLYSSENTDNSYMPETNILLQKTKMPSQSKTSQ